MVKLVAHLENGRRLVLFGISEGNVQRLKERKPIHIHGEEIGLPGLDFAIQYGETEADIAMELRAILGDRVVTRPPPTRQ